MNGINFLADTNIFLYVLEGREEVTPYLDYRFSASVITEIELLGWHKITKEEEALIVEILSTCFLIELTAPIRRKAIEIRQKHKIGTADAIILATAKELSLPLLTADKALSKVEEVEIILIS